MTDHHHHDDRRDGLRLRLFVDGELQDETWLTADTEDEALSIGHATAELHRAACEAAEARGASWMIEAFDPEAPRESAFLRFGTDPAGMVDPIQVAGLWSL